MNKIKFFLGPLLLLYTGILKAQSIDTFYSTVPTLFSNSFKQDSEIIRRKIESKNEFEYSDFNGKRQYIKTGKTIYDRKGKIVEIYHFSNKIDDTINYRIKYKWSSDTLIHAKVYYNSGYEKGKKFILYDDNGNYNGAKFLSDTSVKKNYFIRVELKLNSDFKVYSITYLDYHNQPICVYLPLIVESNSYSGVTKKYDSVVDNGRVISRESIFNYGDQNIKGKPIKATYYRYSTQYKYDSTNRIIRMYDTVRRDNNESSSTTLVTYLDTSKNVIMVHTVDPESNYKGRRTDYYYNSMNKIVRYTYDKNENDSLIDDEYLVNGNYTIHKYNFNREKYTGKEQRIATWEYISVNGLEIEARNCNLNEGIIYKYNYRREKLWNK